MGLDEDMADLLDGVRTRTGRRAAAAACAPKDELNAAGLELDMDAALEGFLGCVPEWGLPGTP